MTVYVRRNGVLVDKETLRQAFFDPMEVRFPTPRISRFDAYESPINGKEITSWGQRDREMRDNDCYDPRDLAPDHVYRRGRDVQLKELKEVRANGERTERDTPGE